MNPRSFVARANTITTDPYQSGLGIYFQFLSCSQNARLERDLQGHLIQPTHFIKKDTKDQRRQGTPVIWEIIGIAFLLGSERQRVKYRLRKEGYRHKKVRVNGGSFQGDSMFYVSGTTAGTGDREKRQNLNS